MLKHEGPIQFLKHLSHPTCDAQKLPIWFSDGALKGQTSLIRYASDLPTPRRYFQHTGAFQMTPDAYILADEAQRMISGDEIEA